MIVEGEGWRSEFSNLKWTFISENHGWSGWLIGSWWKLFCCFDLTRLDEDLYELVIAFFRDLRTHAIFNDSQMALKDSFFGNNRLLSFVKLCQMFNVLYKIDWSQGNDLSSGMASISAARPNFCTARYIGLHLTWVPSTIQKLRWCEFSSIQSIQCTSRSRHSIEFISLTC